MDISEFPISEIIFVKDEWVCDEKYRAILKRRYIDGLTYEKLAEEFNLSDRQIQTICYKYRSKLREKLAETSRKMP